MSSHSAPSWGMARLSYTAIMSVDGYVADPAGGFEWAAPDETVHAFVNDLQRRVGTHLYGRRMYEVMVFWETYAPGDSPAMADFAAIWRAADKIVYSSTLTSAPTAATRIERSFDPDGVRRLKEQSEADLAISGPTLAGQALRAGLVDDIHVFVAPCVVGGGLRAFPDAVVANFSLQDQRTFDSGMVYQRYAVQTALPS